jgi:hypothetical protein
MEITFLGRCTLYSIVLTVDFNIFDVKVGAAVPDPRSRSHQGIVARGASKMLNFAELRSRSRTSIFQIG